MASINNAADLAKAIDRQQPKGAVGIALQAAVKVAWTPTQKA